MDADQLLLWRTELFEALSSTEQAIENVSISMKADAKLPCWVFNTQNQQLLDGSTARNKTRNVIAMLDYVDEQDTRETITLPGVIGCSSQTLQAIETLNQTKTRFKKALQQVQGETLVIDVIKTHQRHIEKRVPLAKHTLEKMGRGRLNVIQTYRHLKIIEPRPIRIGFTWAKTNKVERVSKKQVTRLLSNMGEDENIYNALNTLYAIPEHEILAHVRPPHLHARANLRWDPLAQGAPEKIKQQVNCSLPLCVTCDEHQPLPFGSRLEKPNTEKTRQKRLNQKLEPSPFLEVANVYRYLPQYRTR